MKGYVFPVAIDIDFLTLFNDDDDERQINKSHTGACDGYNQVHA